MAFSNKDIASFIDSDEVSEIDGIRLTKSRSYTHLQPDKKSYKKSVSFSPGHKVTMMEPNYRPKTKKYDSSEYSSEDNSERHMRRQLRKQQREKDLLAMPIRDVDLAKRLLPTRKQRSEQSEQSEQSEISEVSEGGTRRKKKKRKSKKVEDVEKLLIPLTDTSEKIEKNQTAQSKEEIKSMTDGFIVVPRSDWEILEPGSCVKWVNKHGRCITKEWYYWYQKTSKVTGTKFFYFGTYPSKTEGVFQKSFAVFWDNVKILYKKEDPITKLLRQAIDTRQDYITDIAIFLRSKYGDEFDDYMKKRSAHRAKLVAEERAVAKKAEKKKKEEDAIKAQTIRDKHEKDKAKVKEKPLRKPKSSKKPKNVKKLVSKNKFT